MTSGAEQAAIALESMGVDTIFGITGAGNLALIDAIARTTSIKIIYSHHEQAAVMEANGYARTSGKVGVALVTTGGGASNTTTGLLSAFLDSIPVVIIAGNESLLSIHAMKGMRAFGVQGFDSVAVARTVVKSALRVTDPNDVGPALVSAFAETQSGRPGPVFLEIPMDMQRQNAKLSAPLTAEHGYSGTKSETSNNLDAHLKDLITDLSKAERPLLYIGNGTRVDGSFEQALRFAEQHKIPFALSWSAIDLAPNSHPLNLGRIGIYGDRAANIILQKADLVVAIGTRLAIPQVGYDKSDFGRHATKWVIDIDPTELAKFPDESWRPVQASASSFLSGLVSGSQTLTLQDFSTWLTEVSRVWAALPRDEQAGPMAPDGYVHSLDVILAINELADEDAIICTDVGAPLLNGHYALDPATARTIFTSQGLGEMGFGLPGAIGAFFGGQGRQLLCLDTDGAIMFNLQELQVVRHQKIPMKLFIFNNSGYSMIRISQNNLFEGRLDGSDPATGISFPDFADVARTFGFRHTAFSSIDSLKIGLTSLLASPDAELIEIVMSPAQGYFPRLGTGKKADGSLVSPPLEDLSPLISIELLTDLLGYEPLKASFDVRGLS
jgi:acetolactate synthase-1/2/3 large subunit